MAVKARFYSDGDIIDYTLTSAGTAGDPVFNGSLAGILQATGATGDLGSIRVKGVIQVNKDSGTFAAGDNIGWNTTGTDVGGNTGGAATKTTASMNFMLGRCLAAAAGNATTAKVQLNQFAAEGLTNSSAGTAATSLVQITGGGTNYGKIDDNFATIWTVLKKNGLVG